MTQLIVHWQPPEPAPLGPHCRPALERDKNASYMTTTERRDVTCPACKQTDIWKEQP